MSHRIPRDIGVLAALLARRQSGTLGMPITARRVDYDLIARLYDEPGRDFAPDPDLLYCVRAHSPRASFRVLDMGCGTGKQLAADRLALPAVQLAGLDLFYGMLEQAHKRCAAVDWVQGDSMRPPFADASFDYITNQFSYHHIPDKIQMISETYRLLKPGGRFAVTNLDPWSMDDWIVYRYFAASHACDLADFLPESQLISILEHAGFRGIHTRRELSRTEETLGNFLAYASERHRTSHLMEISDRDYEDGIARIKDSIRQLGTDARVPSEICLLWLTGNKPA